MKPHESPLIKNHFMASWAIRGLCEIRVLANNGYPDQTPSSVASDLGLYCLPMSIKKDGFS